MSEDQSVNVKFGGSTEELASVANQAKDLVHGVVEGMTDELKELGGIGKLVTGVFTAMVAVFSVDKIKEGLASVVEEAENVNKFATTLGITTQKASELNMTLSLLGISNESYSAAILGLTRNLRANQAVFEQNGISIKDVNGNLLDSGTILQNTLGFLNGMKDGTERNLAAQGLLGRGWRQLTDLQRINNEQMDKGAKFAHALGQILGEENVEAVHRYNEAMHGMSEVSEAIIQVLGEAFMPIVTEVGEWFMSVGPTAVSLFQDTVNTLMVVIHALIDIFGMFWSVVETVWNSFGELTHAIFGNEAPASLGIFKTILASISILVIGFKFSFTSTFTAIKALLAEGVAWLVMYGNVAKAVFTLDFDGAKAAWTQGMNDIKGIADQAMNDIVDDAVKTRKELDEAVNGKSESSESNNDPEKNGKYIPKQPKGPKSKEVNRTTDWKNEFEEYKIAQADYFKDYNSEELAFWEKKLAIQGLSKKEYAAVEKEIYTLRSSMAKSSLTEQLAIMDQEISTQKSNLGLKIQVLTEEANLIKSKYGERSKEYREMLQKIKEAEREFQEQQVKIQTEALETQKQIDLIGLDQKRQTLAYQTEMGEITNVEQLSALRDLKEQEYQIELQAAQDTAALMQYDVLEYQKAQDKILVAAKKHQLEMDKLSKDVVKAQVDRWKTMLEPITSAFEKSFMGVIQGTLTIRKAMTQMFQSITLGFIQMGVKWLTNWIATQLGLTAATTAGVAARTTAEAAGQSAGLAQMAGNALKMIANYAVQTFAAIYQALAGIPFIGPYIAPAAAAAGMGVVAGVAGSIVSAEGGYDIPKGVNPIGQLHEQEMVLPKEQANAVRDMAAGGGGKIIINTTGGDFIHKDDLAKLLKQMNRRFVSIKQ